MVGQCTKANGGRQYTAGGLYNGIDTTRRTPRSQMWSACSDFGTEERKMQSVMRETSGESVCMVIPRKAA
jgi:hypothetical protein